MERAWKPSVEACPSCPRCGCSNTKFCYYNNYSLTQPRYFCKGCRRYWTKGGSLRNVPVGGGCRKNRRGVGNNNKSLRLSSDSKTASFGFGSSTSCSADIIAPAIGQYRNYGSSCESRSDNGSSHVDLALVYANFLSQKPELDDDNNNNSNVVPGLPSLETFSMPHQIIADENHGGDDDQHIFFCGLDSFHQKHSYDNQERSSSHDRCCHPGDFGLLPPLPSQESMLWSNPPHGSLNNMFGQTMQVSRDDQLPMVGPEGADDHQEESLLNGNWSPFDLPISDDTSFSRGNANI